MKALIVYFCLTIILTAQTFKVDKVNGEVFVLQGTTEKFLTVKEGDDLNANDMIITGEDASVQLRNGNNIFSLKTNSALNLNTIKKLTINELLLALAMEEIRAVPKKSNSGMKSTAVYGSSKNNIELKSITSSLGMKKLNGAKQLAESGFHESAVLAAREIFRKHPETQKAIPERLYFAGVFEKLKLPDEALNEYSAVYELKLNPDQKRLVAGKIQSLIKK